MKDIQPLKIVILDDSPDDVDLIERELKKAGINFSSRTVQTRTEFEQALEDFRPDVVLSDHSMPRFNSIEAFECVQTYEKACDLVIPFILVSGQVPEEFAVQCIKAGVDDYIMKDRLRRLPLSIQNALEKCRIETERRKYLREVILKEALMTEAEHLAQLGSWQVDFVSGKHTWSDELYYICGYEKKDLEPSFDAFFNLIHPEDARLLKEEQEEFMKNGSERERELRIIDKQGQLRYLSCRVKIYRDADGKPLRMLGFNLDITARKAAEESVKEAVREIKKQNEQLKEIAHIQSHEVRAPLARVMGIVSLLKSEGIAPSGELPALLAEIAASANELDLLIRKIVRKTEQMSNKEE